MNKSYQKDIRAILLYISQSQGLLFNPKLTQMLQDLLKEMKHNES